MSVPIPTTLPLTYPDAVCVLDLDPFGAETTSDLQTLVQDVYHELIELPGTNPDDVDAGIGVTNYLSGAVPSTAQLVSRIQTRFGEDERISTVSATIDEVTGPNGAVSFELHIQLGVAGGTLGLGFEFTQKGGLQFLPTGIQWP